MVVWMITDDKPGHRNQLLGLQQSLQTLADVEVHWFSVGTLRQNMKAAPRPDWVVGAGHRTHWSLLYCKWFKGAKAIVLMKPSLPKWCFDACIIPQHDHPAPADHILVTLGVLNTMQPNYGPRPADQGVFLIGGDNQHYQWDTGAILDQVQAICEAQPAVHWQITDSRRTPADFATQLMNRQLPNLTYLTHQQTPPGWVKQQLESAAQVWVTRDSVSMVYESLTAGAPTGLLAMTPLRPSRVVQGMAAVLNGYAQDFEQWNVADWLPTPKQPLWEADRAARWLLQRWGVAA